MKLIKNGSTKLNVRRQGNGPPLLLVHGFPLDHTMWDAQIAELSRDYQVIAPDLRGFGASDLGSEPMSMQSLADDLAALLDDLQVTQPVVFCGLSMGGYIAWQFWDRHPERLERLILCDTRAAADSPEVAQGRRDTAARVLSDGTKDATEGMLPKLLATDTFASAPALVESVRRVMQSTDPHTFSAALLAMAARPDMQPRLAEIDVPTLVICGQHDAITPAAEMRQLASSMPAAQFAEIASAGHLAPTEQPAEVNRAICEFLKAER